MSRSIGPELLRASLTLAFVAAAVIKVVRAAEPSGAMGSEPVRFALIAIELAIGVGLWTRYARTCCFGAMLVAIGGIGLNAYSAATGQEVSCGCLGTVELNRMPHVALSTVIFLLGLRVQAADATRRRSAGASATAR